MIKRLLKLTQEEKKEIVNYLIFGLLTTAVNYSAFFLLLWLFPQITTIAANSLAWFSSLLFAYFTNRRWVFQSQTKGLKAVIREFSWFLAGRIFSLISENVIVYLGIDIWHQQPFFVKLIGQGVVVILNYLFSKKIFKPFPKNK